MRFAHWVYATTGFRLTISGLDRDMIRYVRRVFVLVPVLYVGAGAIAWASPGIAILCFALIPILYVIPTRQTRHLTSLNPIEPPPSS